MEPCQSLATTYDASSGQYVLYCNGGQVAAITTPDATAIGGSGGGPDVPVYIGVVPWEDAYSVWENDFSGCVERVLIYREALTQDQVQQVILLTDDDPAL